MVKIPFFVHKWRHKALLSLENTLKLVVCLLKQALASLQL